LPRSYQQLLDAFSYPKKLLELNAILFHLFILSISFSTCFAHSALKFIAGSNIVL